jgi:hypothetical protein
MYPRGSFARVGSRRARMTGPAVVAAALLALAAGCTSSTSAKPAGGSTSGASITTCGRTRTGANVPVKVEVVHGQVPCGTAMTVEEAYARAMRSGQVQGNGGGAPIRIKGWTCQGFATPTVLRTGNASKCVRGGAEILAVLPSPA